MAELPKPEEVQKLVGQMRDWLNKQPHLPKDLDDKLIKRFLHSCYYDLEHTKTTADLFFNIRASASEVISNRDPVAPHMQKTFKIVNLAQIQISGNRNLFIWQLNDPGLDNYDYLQDLKIFFLSTDAWLLSDNNLEEADIVIMDVKDISLKFITKFNISLARKVAKYQEDAMPIRLKQIHVVNAPPFIDKIFGLLKPFLKPEVTSMIHFHVPKSETLHQYLDKSDLPEDFGGTLDRMDIYMTSVLDLIDTWREPLLKENLWMADKKLKSKSDPVEVETFRSLAID